MTSGRFITIEGGEGTGKSTLIAALSNRLTDKGVPHLLTREPGGTPLAERIRELVLSPPGDDEWSPVAEALLMNAARADHVEKKIAPALARGEWVVCDRFIDSTRVYQGIGGVSDELLAIMQQEVTAQAFPDLTLILDAPVDMVIERRADRGTTDTFEARPTSFHEAVREGFLRVAAASPDRCVVIDALQVPAAVLDQALKAIEERLK